ncbi:CDP-glycerol glycerophosphotransferase family protein [Methanobrevibacter sp.]
MNIVSRFWTKFKNYRVFKQNTEIYEEYAKPIIDNLVYVESRDGGDFTGNIFRIVEELSSGDYGDFEICVYAKNNVPSKIKQFQNNYNLKIDRIVTNEIDALKVLGRAKYIFTDAGMRPRYFKRPGQIFFNTWHGTPLKVMGVHNMPEEHRTGNVQHPFLSSDYLLYPNDYMREKMMTAFMIDKMYPGKILMEGYPRNSIFFDQDRAQELKAKLKLDDKELFAYMPTYKGILMERKDEEQKDEIHEILKELDKRLKDNQILLVKLHVYNESKINFRKFKHIRAFPKGYEIYDVINMADVLVTDYSSVFFDYANSRKKIVLYNYDEAEYLADRGVYIPLNDLPFPKVQTIEDLVDELNSPKNYDDTEFVERFCTYERPDAAKYICQHVFNGENVCREDVIVNEKPNVLIYAGDLLKNGVTTSLINFLSNVDTEKYNFFVSFRQWSGYVRRYHQYVFEEMPEGIQFMPLRTGINLTLPEKKAFNGFVAGKRGTKLPKMVDDMFERELNRYFPNFPFDYVINFDGTTLNELLLFSKPDVKCTVWVHKDKLKSMKFNHDQNYNGLKEAYTRYDDIIVVDDALIKPTAEIKCSDENISVIHNINNVDKIKEKSEGEIEFIEERTFIHTTHSGGIEGILSSDALKFISIGNIEPQKGYNRLVKAFNRFCDDYPDTQLLIIGGHGEFQELIKTVSSLKHGDNISIIKWVNNPMPVLKRCDLFIQSSEFEGWSMVAMEANTLGMPIISTDIIGSKWINDNGGYLVPNSENGLLQGMYDFMNNEINDFDYDYDSHNEKAVREFNDLISKNCGE